MAEPKKCVECGADLSEGQAVCPKCGAEQPVKWLTWLVYILLGLFVIGAIYRLIFP
jgi:RNA polymerase subunit RPABC4/transcription elongation factor Spt4